jgi:hypothetical protein
MSALRVVGMRRSIRHEGVEQLRELVQSVEADLWRTLAEAATVRDLGHPDGNGPLGPVGKHDDPSLIELVRPPAKHA